MGTVAPTNPPYANENKGFSRSNPMVLLPVSFLWDKAPQQLSSRG
jgi:hypothetical protein